MGRGAIAVVVLLWSVAARGQTDADRATARALGERAHSALDSGDFRTAEDLFRRAGALIEAPTLTLGLARAQAGLGRLVAAHESYQRVVRWELGPRPPRAFVAALDAGKAEIAVLAKRLPSLVISVQNGEGATVTVDGQPIPDASLGVPRFVDPGKHVVSVTAGGAVPRSLELEIAESETKPVTLTLDRTVARPGSVVTRAVAVPPVARIAAKVETHPGAPPGASSAGALGGALLGAGIAGVVAGVSTGAVALSERPGADGTPEQTASYRRMRNLSLASLGGGGVAVLAGSLFGTGRAEGSTRRSLGYGLVGAGIAGLVVGGASGIMNRNVHSHLADACPDRVCPSSERPNSDSLRHLGIVSIGSFAVGAASLGVGTVLLLSEGSGERRQASRSLLVKLSPRAMTLEGTW
jgi:hypothetical protein